MSDIHDLLEKYDATLIARDVAARAVADSVADGRKPHAFYVTRYLEKRDLADRLLTEMRAYATS